MSYFPNVLRKQENGDEIVCDLPSCLLQERIILLDGEIDSGHDTVGYIRS